MKIISKHKDYYDHLVGHFGYDDSRVYDRRNSKDTKFWGMDRMYIHVAGTRYPLVLKKKNDKPYFKKSPDLDVSDNEFLEGPTPSKLNVKFREPVLITNEWEYGTSLFTKYIPRLADFGFAAVIPAEEIYRIIYDFLGWLKDNPEIPNKQTDKEKIVAHGFDLKASFRPKRK